MPRNASWKFTFPLTALWQQAHAGYVKLKASPFISFIIIPLVLIVGCSRQSPETKPEAKSGSNISDPFRSQLMQFLSSASRLNAATETGVTKEALRSLISDTKGQFDLLQGLWPDAFCSDGKTDIQEAVKGWSYAASDLGGGGSHHHDQRYTAFYSELAAYEKTNPFGIQFTHYTEFEGDDIINLGDNLGEKYNNMPNLLLIASKYFERGRQSILKALK